MAKTAISAGDIAILRGNQSIETMRVHITPLDTISSGTITAIPAVDPYVNVTWDGSTSGVSVGQMVKITNGTTVRTWGIVRKAPVSTTLYINEVPLGSPGYTTEIESAIQVGDTVTVYKHRPLWGLHTRINNRVFYFGWDIAYSDQNENIPPVANAGKWQSAKVAVGSTASFTLPRFGTNTSFAMSGTVSSHLWTLPTGVTLKSGYATSDSVIEVDAEAGRHLVSYRVTDSNAKTHTAYVWLFVSDGVTGTSLDERYPVSGLTVNQTQKGFTGSLTIAGTSLEDVIYPGAGILINEVPHFANGTLTDGVLVDCFIGYITNVDYSYDASRISTATVSFESPLVYADRIVQPEQSLTEVANPANWTQCTSAMSNPRGAFYYAVKHKSDALLDMHDFDANGLTTPRRKSIAYNTKTLGQAIDLVAKLFLVNIGSAADGSSVMREFPQYMDNTDRNALAVRMTWTAQDFSLQGGLRYSKNLLSQLAETVGGAFNYNGVAPKANFAGKKWNQGSSSATMPNFTVDASGAVNTLLEKVGHYHAEQNRPILEIPLTLIGNQDVIDPAYMIWDRLTIAATYDPRGEGWSNARMIARRVNRTWNKTANGYEKTITIGLQPETFGQPGKEIPIGNVRTSNTNRLPITFTPQVNEALGALGVMLVVNDVGQLAVTYDYLADSPQWTDISGRFTGNICDFDWDYNSAFFTSGNAITEALSVYVCTIDDTDFYVYRVDDIKSPTFFVEILHTDTLSDSTANYNARIRCSRTTPTLVLAAWKDRTGIEFVRSTDGGDTWSSKANIGSAITDSADNDDAPIGMDIYGVVQVITAPDSTPEYGLYIATTASGSFSAVTGTERDSTPNPMIKLDSTSSGYVTTGATADSEVTETVTFDGGGYAYTLNAGTNSAPAIEAVGNPDNCAREEGSSGTDENVDFNIDIELGSVVPVTSFSFDGWHSSYSDPLANYVNTEYKVNFYDGVSLVDAVRVWAFQGDREAWNNSSEIDVTGSEPTLPGTAFFIWEWLSTSYPDGIECDRVNIEILNTNQVNDWDWRIDNIAITYGSAGTAAALYRVTTLGGTSDWTDISPAADKAPVRPHDLAIDIINTDTINTVADDDIWYQSVDNGDNWTTEESATDKRVPYSVGTAVAFGGDSEVTIALDGSNFDSKTGNLSAVWSTISVIKKVLIL